MNFEDSDEWEYFVRALEDNDKWSDKFNKQLVALAENRIARKKIYEKVRAALKVDNTAGVPAEWLVRIAEVETGLTLNDDERVRLASEIVA